jgi:hypothetical protein
MITFAAMFKTLLYLLLLAPVIAFADTPSGFGGIAQNLLEPVSVLTDFINSACLAIGFALLFASFVKYMEHRRNPMAVLISNVILLLVLGIVLLCMPLAYKLVYEEPPAAAVVVKK